MSTSRHFNTPGEMLARLVYLAHLLLAGWGGLLFFTAAMHHNRGFMLKACGMVAVSSGLRWALARQHHLSDSRRSFDNMFLSSALAADSPDERRFTALLERQRMFERARGTPSFDPWELLCLQREIAQCLREHPEFSELADDPHSTDD